VSHQAGVLDDAGQSKRLEFKFDMIEISRKMYQILQLLGVGQIYNNFAFYWIYDERVIGEIIKFSKFVQRTG
jgi:hypothetical protein